MLHPAYTISLDPAHVKGRERQQNKKEKYEHTLKDKGTRKGL